MTHILHYNTHAERRYFLGTDRVCYDLVGLNGNIVSHSPDGVAAFLATVAKPFYIDPQTHAFQHSTVHLKRKVKSSGAESGMEFKPSVIRLAEERLGEPFTKVVKKDRPLTTQDFLDDNGKPKSPVITKVCEKVIHFQTQFLSDSIDDETREFMDDQSSLFPNFVVAPYFYLSPLSWSEWLTINIAFYKQAKSMLMDTQVYLALFLHRGLLGQRTEIIQGLEKALSSVDGVLLWIDEHEEETLTEAQCTAFIELLKSLRNLTSSVLNAHGGYLSTLLCHHDVGPLLAGVGHSPNYGEHREVVPIGGGIPRARFYLKKAHSGLPCSLISFTHCAQEHTFP